MQGKTKFQGIKGEQGFTLIELIMVIVILGILAAVATPKFFDLSGDAESAALDGVVGVINSASSVNYGAHMAGNTNAETFTDTTDTCTSMATAILMEGIPSGYTLPTTALTQDEGDVVTCAVTQTATGNSQNASIIWVE